MIVDMLKTAVSSGTGTSARIKGQTVGGKTGTNSDQKGVFFAGMTGYYSSALWIGHDNYKALSSKTTGGNSAAKLWQKIMSRVHTEKGLKDRDILQGKAEDYGLVKVTTCAVSGQLTTEACLSDRMGYGTKTDWWPADSLPRVSCQLHVQRVICSESGMLASPSCEHTETCGVISLPKGHPLEKYIGTEYQSVLEDYLGITVSGSSLCTWHGQAAEDPLFTEDPNTEYAQQQEEESGPDDPVSLSELRTGAQNLIVSATQQLGWLEPESEEYLRLYTAIQNLVMQLNAGAGPEALAAAMSNVSQVMNGM
jgi:penicillin-binding protein 1A